MNIRHGLPPWPLQRQPLRPCLLEPCSLQPAIVTASIAMGRAQGPRNHRPCNRGHETLPVAILRLETLAPCSPGPCKPGLGVRFLTGVCILHPTKRILVRGAHYQTIPYGTGGRGLRSLEPDTHTHTYIYIYIYIHICILLL